jgi:hypothetical protein
VTTTVPFHGSYPCDDVTFLLQPLTLQPVVDVLEKERLIQSGARHYSEMVGLEHLPSPTYLRLFHAAVTANAERMARDTVHLARRIRAARAGGAVTLVSLARAGTPVGVLLHRVLARCWGLEAPHYSISVIRDRGVDAAALDHILARHAPESVVFIDGWTAKGAITRELRGSVARYNQQRQTRIAPDLFVLSDLAGLACASGSTDDYLIPSALLGASISGLISRSILNEQVGPGQFHGCLFYADHADWQAHDLSRWFIDRLLTEVTRHQTRWLTEPLVEVDRAAVRQRSTTRLTALAQRHAVTNLNFIKPGIGETTRALLRRAPRRLVLRDSDAADVSHLVQLARERDLPIDIDPTLDLHAVAIIRKLTDG